MFEGGGNVDRCTRVSLPALRWQAIGRLFRLRVTRTGLRGRLHRFHRFAHALMAVSKAKRNTEVSERMYQVDSRGLPCRNNDRTRADSSTNSNGLTR